MDKIKVNIENEIYNNDEGFRIYAGTMDFERISIKVDGFELCNGIKTLVGTMGTYKGSKSFVCKYEEFDSSSKTAQKNLLMSIKGIKESTADMILSKIDDINIFKTDNYPRIKGIGPAKILLIKEGIQLLDNMETFKELNILLGSNTTPKKIKKITEVIETMENGLDEFKKNPYLVLIEYAGFGFKSTDKIAVGMGIKYNDKNRQKYLIEYIVKQYTQTGNCFITKKDLDERLNKCNIKANKELIENNNRLVIEDSKVYTVSMFEAETKIPELLQDIKYKKVDIKKLDSYEVKNMIKEFEKINKIKFDNTQVEAIETAVNNNISILTGGAGTGKTTLLKCVLYILKELSFNNYLTAPTGKAARRMEQSTGMEATTIHRFLYEAMNSYTKKNGVMIVDEFSMVDTELLYDLLATMEDSPIDFKKIIFVGDPGQLQSVQPGNCLYDLMESKTIKLITLTKVFRQKGESNIIDIATKVRNNEMFNFIKKKDFFVRECSTPSNYIDTIKYFFSYLYEKYSSIDNFFSEVQFITPVKKGDVGVININEIIKNEINPRGDKKDWFPFDINDKIMCTKNDKENGIMNGEFGRITEVEKTTFTIYFKDLERYVTYKKDTETISNFILSYCSTVHKLQGSEFKYVVIVLPQDSLFLDSRLLYTAITRGKQTVILLTSKDVVTKVVERNNLLKRNTYLKERILNY